MSGYYGSAASDVKGYQVGKIVLGREREIYKIVDSLREGE